MTIYEFAEAMVASFPSTFSEDTEFTYDPDECTLLCLNLHGPDVSIMFCEVDGKDDVVISMEFVNTEDDMNWMDQQGSKEYKRLEEFALEAVKSHGEMLEEEEITFHVAL